MKTTNAGIDYGLGRTNIDPETGIRFGVIQQNHCEPEMIDDIWQSGRNLSFESYLAEAKDKLKSALWDYFSDYHHKDDPSKLDVAANDAFDAIEQKLSDQYEGQDDTYLYESDGYRIKTDETDLCILKSPYFTFCQLCSPCAPGAGYIENSCDPADGGVKAYCLGHDFWQDGAPYPVYSVETGKQIISKEVKDDCPNCHGSGRRTLQSLADARDTTLAELLTSIHAGNIPQVQAVDFESGTFQCFRCDGSGKVTSRQTEEINA